MRLVMLLLLFFVALGAVACTPMVGPKPQGGDFIQPDVPVPQEFRFDDEVQPISMATSGGFRFVRYSYRADGHYGTDRLAQWFSEHLTAAGWSFVSPVPVENIGTWGMRYRKGENDVLTIIYAERKETPDVPAYCVLNIAIGK